MRHRVSLRYHQAESVINLFCLQILKKGNYSNWIFFFYHQTWKVEIMVIRTLHNVAVPEKLIISIFAIWPSYACTQIFKNMTFEWVCIILVLRHRLFWKKTSCSVYHVIMIEINKVIQSLCIFCLCMWKILEIIRIWTVKAYR